MSGLPGGMKEQTLADYDADEARAFDQGVVNNLLMNKQERQTGAAALLTGQEQISNPVGYTSAAMQGNQSIMQAPLWDISSTNSPYRAENRYPDSMRFISAMIWSRSSRVGCS